MEPITLTVEQPCGDLLEFLAVALPSLPLTRLRRLIAHGDVLVDGRRVGHLCVPEPGQTVTLLLPDKPIVEYRPEKMPVAVLYEDADTLAVDKPAGLNVIPEPGSLDAPFLNGLLYYVQHDSPNPCERVHVVHRLDRETSGVILLAKHGAAARYLSERFERREVTKHYLAVVRGEVAAEEGEIDLPIAQGSRGRMLLRARRGRPALSRYRVSERFRNFTLLDVQPLTGRQHQVRLHLSGIGHPLAVDPLYGGREAVYLSEIKPGYRAGRMREMPNAECRMPNSGQMPGAPRRPSIRDSASVIAPLARGETRPEPPLMGRLTLHARRIEVALADGRPLVAEAPLPEDFDRLLRALRKYGRRASV